jgi:DHA1 family bicyclomycin/chloramphenicol resistance-like MFS transporter
MKPPVRSDKPEAGVDDVTAKHLRDRQRDKTPWSLLLLLMATTAIGPTSLNILVPAVPELSHQFGTPPTTMQLTVSLFLIGLAVAQLVMGPLSDRFGRRPVMLGGLALTVFASLMAIVMPTVESVIAARVLQAIGASAGIVVARAIIRDLFDRERAASVLGLVATVMVAAPTLGPLIGGLLETFFRWQAIFIFTALTALAVALWAAATLPETRGLNAPAEQREGFWRDLLQLARSRVFIGYVLVASFGSSTFFVFLGGTPHIMVTLMGRTSAEYGLWFAASSVGYMAGNFAASRLAMRHGIHPLIFWGIVFEIVGVALATALAATAHDYGPVIVFAPQLIISFGNGLLLPGAIAGATSVRPQAAGTAAGIIGCAQMGIGAAVVQYAARLLADATSALPMAVLMAVMVVGLTLSFALLGRRSR